MLFKRKKEKVNQPKKKEVKPLTKINHKISIDIVDLLVIEDQESFNGINSDTSELVCEDISELSMKGDKSEVFFMYQFEDSLVSLFSYKNDSDEIYVFEEIADIPADSEEEYDTWFGEDGILCSNTFYFEDRDWEYESLWTEKKTIEFKRESEADEPGDSYLRIYSRDIDGTDTKEFLLVHVVDGVILINIGYKIMNGQITGD